MKNNKKRMSVLILLLLVGVITIGYAALSANLTINGTSTINNATWNVHFKSGSITPATGSVTASSAPTIDGTGLNISYAVTLEKPGDFYEFTVVVENTGSVNAKLNALPTLTGVDTNQDVYVNYTFTHSDGSAITTLADENLNGNGGTKTYKVRVEFDPNINNNQLPGSAQTLNLTVGLNYVQN